MQIYGNYSIVTEFAHDFLETAQCAANEKQDRINTKSVNKNQDESGDEDDKMIVNLNYFQKSQDAWFCIPKSDYLCTAFTRSIICYFVSLVTHPKRFISFCR